MILVLLTALLAQEPQIPFADLIRDSSRLLNFTVALDALEEDPVLLDRHRGLSRYLETHPAMALTETAYREQLRLPSFRRLTGALEEALDQDAGARTRFDEYYTALERSDALTSKVDTFKRIELREGRRDSSFAAAMVYLKRHPDDAMIFLANPLRLLPTPEALYPLRNRFRNDRDVQTTLQEAFWELDQDAAVHQYVFPWWETAFDDSGEVGAAFLGLDAYLSRYPRRFWVWQRRNTAWAAAPQAQSWLWHSYGQIRRNDSLRDTYFEFVATLDEHPELKDTLEDSWNEDHGAPQEWPPKDRAPELPPLVDSGEGQIDFPERPARPSRGDMLPERPKAPRSGIRVPERPTRPTPARPKEPVPRGPDDRLR